MPAYCRCGTEKKSSSYTTRFVHSRFQCISYVFLMLPVFHVFFPTAAPLTPFRTLTMIITRKKNKRRKGEKKEHSKTMA